MRTAHEWYLKINSHSNPATMNDVEREWVEKMINEARKEAIEECAEVAKAVADWYRGRFTGNAYVDKDSILSLIKELK